MQTPANLSFESVCRSIMVATSFHINLLCHCFPTQQILAQVLSKRCFLISLRSSVVRQALDKLCPKQFFPVSISHFVSVFVFYFSVLFKDMLFAVFLFAWKEVPVCPRNWLTSRSPICARSIWVEPMHSEHLEILDDRLLPNLNHLKSASALLLSGMQGQVGATKGGWLGGNLQLCQLLCEPLQQSLLIKNVQFLTSSLLDEAWEITVILLAAKEYCLDSKY